MTLNTFSMPANTTMDDVGTNTAGWSVPMTISAFANEPGRSTPRSFGTSASIVSVRFCSWMDGDNRTTRPRYVVGSPSTVTMTSWPTCTLTAARSGIASASRIGWTRTSVATGVPAIRYSPTPARRSRMIPSAGASNTVSVSAWRAMSSSDLRWAKIAWRLRASSRASWYLASATCSAATAVSSWARATRSCCESFSVRSRVNTASSSWALAWRTTAVFSTATRSSVPSGISPSLARAWCSAASA